MTGSLELTDGKNIRAFWSKGSPLETIKAIAHRAFWGRKKHGRFNEGGWWFYPNSLDKFTVTMRDHPKFSDDGFLTLYFQHNPPRADKLANWLPAPSGDFLLTLRMY
jgi:hypothetical protein